jgi:hypothetical protein
MLDDGQHALCVDAWLEGSATGLPPEALLRLFEVALDAVWIRTNTTLGEVTLTAIGERVLHNASEQFSLLSSLKIEPTRGIQCRELRVRIGSVDAVELRGAIRFVLVELLTVIGNLTAEILTPALHAEISRVVLPGAIRAEAKPVRQSDQPVNAESGDKRSWRK